MTSFISTNFPRAMFVWWILLLSLLLSNLTETGKDSDVELEPGHAKQDYDSIEEINSVENETETEKPAKDESSIREAILDVAYYLRRFKFSGYDPRYLTKGDIPKQDLFIEFPSPPLRNIHWEVKKNCEPSFVECIKYLQEQVSQTVLPRRLDSVTITKQNRWSLITDKDLITSADNKCVELLKTDQRTFDVFFGPLQKFQWLTSASYYMCMYTMKEIPQLKTFAEDCDNYGSCIHWELGINNKDVRGDNSQPFACALYSFCPDPCCPLKYLPERFACQKASSCPDGFSFDRTCSFLKEENSNFESLILNQWNISCQCDQPGMRWESKSGMCVDIDECIETKFPCNYPSETCKNLPGSYKCACSMLGYHTNPYSNTCEKDFFLQHVLFPPQMFSQNATRTLSGRFSNKLQNIVNTVKSFISVNFGGNRNGDF